MFDTISIKTCSNNELIDITKYIDWIVASSQIKDGICIVYSPHTTSAITINEGFDPDVKTDILDYLNSIVPDWSKFLHMEWNSDAHIKSSLLWVSQTIIIKNWKLLLWRWQKIYFCEFDWPRDRNIYVKIK